MSVAGVHRRAERRAYRRQYYGGEYSGNYGYGTYQPYAYGYVPALQLLWWIRDLEQPVVPVAHLLRIRARVRIPEAVVVVTIRAYAVSVGLLIGA
jgi:hypothetical protein